MDHPKAVAEAAEGLLKAIKAARAAGYRVPFPEHALVSIPVSETSRTAQPAPVAEDPPVPVIGRASKA